MKKNIVLILILALASMALMGESCVTKDTQVDVPVRTEQDLLFEARGNDPTDSGEETVNFLQLITDAEADVDVDSLVSVNIENGYWRVARNGGDPALVISGFITVTRLSTGVTEDLISFTSVSVSSVLGPFQLAPLDADGVALLNEGFAEYIAWRQSGGAMPNLNYRFNWSTTASATPLDFDWEARIRLSIVGTVTIEVPEVL